MAPIPPAGCDFPKAETLTFTHTFAASGSYELLLVNSTFPDDGKVVDGGSSSPDLRQLHPDLHRRRPPSPSRPACEPFLQFGPGTVVSAG